MLRSGQSDSLFPGTVTALDSEASSGAALYASLTGREYRTCYDLAQLVVSSSNDVLVCRTSTLSPELLHLAYVRNALAPGLIFAPTSAEIERVCRKQVNALLAGTASSRRIFLYSATATPVSTAESDVCVTDPLPTKELESLLSSSPAIMSIIGGGDGMDALISRQYLCPFLASETADPTTMMPACLQLTRCTRFPTLPTIDEARKRGWIIPLSTITARILLLFSCNALRLPDGIIDGAYGLAQSVLRQANVGAIITVWSDATTAWEGYELEELVERLSSGTPVGEAVSRFNVGETAMRSGLRLCVLGDPCVTVGPKDAFRPFLPNPAADVRIDPVVPRNSCPDNYVEMLRAGLRFVSNSTRYLTPELHDEIDSDLGRLSATGSADQRETVDGSRLDRLLLDFLAAEPSLSKLFRPLGSTTVEEYGRCSVCMSPARIFSTTFGPDDISSRQTIVCARCREISNLPVAWRPKIDLTNIMDGLVLLHDLPPDCQLKLCVVNPTIRTQDFSLDTQHVSTTSHVVRIPERQTNGLLQCQILIARRLELGSLGFRFRRMANGTYASTADYGRPSLQEALGN